MYDIKAEGLREIAGILLNQHKGEGPPNREELLVNELATIIQMEEHKVEEIAQFFAHYSFIQINPVKNKVKIDPDLRKIFHFPVPVEEKV